MGEVKELPPEPARPLTESERERLKLRVEFHARLGVNFVTFGAVTPAALLLEQPAAAAIAIVGVSWAFIVFGFALYSYASWLLRRLG